MSKGVEGGDEDEGDGHGEEAPAGDGGSSPLASAPSSPNPSFTPLSFCSIRIPPLDFDVHNNSVRMGLAEWDGVWHSTSMREHKEIEPFMVPADGHAVQWLQLPIPCHEVTCRPKLHRQRRGTAHCAFRQLAYGSGVDEETNR